MTNADAALSRFRRIASDTGVPLNVVLAVYDNEDDDIEDDELEEKVLEFAGNWDQMEGILYDE